MKIEIRKIVKKIPLVSIFAKMIYKLFKHAFFSSSKKYWEKRYSSGKTSGYGSYGELANFKAESINSFVKKK